MFISQLFTKGGLAIKYHAPAKCPVCGHNMQVTRLHCVNCNTELTGEFIPCRFCNLEDKHLQFVETFLRCRGSIKEMEKVLGVSYPTVRNMMDAALSALSLDNKPSALPPKEREADRKKILDQLNNGEIDAEAAIAALREMKGE